MNDEGNISAHPVDRGWAWVIMLASFSIHFLCVGMLRSLGILFVEFQERFGSSSAETSAINGIEMLTYSLITLLVMNVILKYTSVRCVCILGSLMQFLGLSLSSQVNHVSELVITMGIVFGCGHALLYCPIQLIVSQYFDKRRPIATVIATCGVSIGGIAIPYITRYLLDEYALKGALLLLASGISLQQLIISILITPPSSYYFEIETVPEAVAENQTQGILYSNTILGDNNKKEDEYGNCDRYDDYSKDYDSTLDHMIRKDLPLASPHKLRTTSECSGSYNTPKSPNYVSSHSLKSSNSTQVSLKETVLQAISGDIFGSLNILNTRDSKSARDLHAKQRASDATSFSGTGPTETKSRKWWRISFPDMAKTPTFWLATPFFICGAVGSAVPCVYLPALAIEKGLTNDDGALLLLVSAATDFAGRLAPGVILHFGYMRPSTVVILPLGLCGTLYMFTHLFTNKISLILFSAFFGFLSSTFWSTQTLVMIELIGIEKLGPALAFYSIAMGTGIAASYPLAGALRDLFGTYDTTYKYFGAMYYLCVLSIVLVQFIGNFVGKSRSKSVQSDDEARN